MAEGMIDTLTSRLAKLEPLPGSPLDLPRRAPLLLARFYKEHQKAPKGLKDGEEAGKGKTSTRARTTINASLQDRVTRSEEHTDELQTKMSKSYDVFSLQ